METKLYRVVRDHIGPEGQLFSPRSELNTREAYPHEVQHLVPQTLVLLEDEAEPAPETTPEKAPENKAENAPEKASGKPARKAKDT